MKNLFILFLLSVFLLAPMGKLFSQTANNRSTQDEVQKYFTLVLSKYGMVAGRDIIIERNNSILTAEALIRGTQRYILYNENWMKNLSIGEKNSTYWTNMAVLCHEIGHHIKGHTIDTEGNSDRNSELEADEWVGDAMYKLGATLEEAKFYYLTLPKSSIAGYPNRSERMNSMMHGYLNAQSADTDLARNTIGVREIGNKHYRVFRSNNLLWMGDNLNHPIENSICHNGDCQKFGREYGLHEAKKACENVGWRLPTQNEWRNLNGLWSKRSLYFIQDASYWTSTYKGHKILKGEYEYHTAWVYKSIVISERATYVKLPCRCVKEIE